MDISSPEVSDSTFLRSLSKFNTKELIRIVGPTRAAALQDYLNRYEYDSIDEFVDAVDNYVTDLNELLTVPMTENELDIMAKALASKLVANKYDQVEERLAKKQLQNAKKAERKLSNRATYLLEPVMARRHYFDKEKNRLAERWQGEADMKAGGLMRLAVEAEYGKQTTPVVFAVQNLLTPQPEVQDNGKVKMVKPEVALQAWKKMESLEVRISGERLAWNETSVGFTWLKQLFPKVIDARAYNHSLNAPVLPGGFHKLTIQLRDIKTVDSEGNEISAETDGCGRIHPAHPLFEALQRPGGSSTIQFRFINTEGWFCKGILVPDERCLSEEGAPEIWVDWMQVKGAHKNSAKNSSKNNEVSCIEGYLGVLQAWDRRRSLKWSFEQLQMFNCNDTTRNIIDQWVDEAYVKLLGNGIEGLMAGIASESPTLELTLQMASQINAMGIKFNCTQIKMVKNAVYDRLRRILYFVAQGAGLKGTQAVSAIDNGIPEGCVVAAGYKYGTEVIVHRFPTLLPQSIMKLKVIAPLPHHKVNGKIVRNTIFMNTRDLVDKAQGDSDGDLVGITADPRALELWKHRIGSNQVYMVEPDGIKFDLQTEDVASRDYMRGDPRGPVGIMCLHQAKLFAVGDVNGAIAMSIPYQEAVDVAKNKINWSDFRRAADFNQWTHNETTNRWHFTHRIPHEEWPEDEIPLEMISEWVGARLCDNGVRNVYEQNVISWHRSSKAIDIQRWEPCWKKGNFTGGNLVHYCHDRALEVWQRYSAAFNFDEEEVDISDVLDMFLKSQGHEIDSMLKNWAYYQRTIRTTSGIRDFGNEVAKIQSSDMEDKARVHAIDVAYLKLNDKLMRTSLEDLAIIWKMENTAHWKVQLPSGVQYTTEMPKDVPAEILRKNRVNNPNHAFRAIAWVGSPVLKMMNIEKEIGCDFLKKEDVVNYKGNTYSGQRKDILVDIAMSSENPEQKLTEMIFNSKQHSKECKDAQDNPIPGSQCPHCTKTLHNALVHRIRKQKTSAEHDFIRSICTTLRQLG